MVRTSSRDHISSFGQKAFRNTQHTSWTRQLQKLKVARFEHLNRELPPQAVATYSKPWSAIPKYGYRLCDATFGKPRPLLETQLIYLSYSDIVVVKHYS